MCNNIYVLPMLVTEENSTKINNRKAAHYIDSPDFCY